MASSARVQRVADLLQQVLSEALMREISDPRLQMVSISAVDVSRDLSCAKVYISTFGDEEKAKEALKALERANGFLRRWVSRQTELRITPELRFYHDASIVSGNKMSQLIDQAIAKSSDNDAE